MSSVEVTFSMRSGFADVTPVRMMLDEHLGRPVQVTSTADGRVMISTRIDTTGGTTSLLARCMHERSLLDGLDGLLSDPRIESIASVDAPPGALEQLFIAQRDALEAAEESDRIAENI